MSVRQNVFRQSVFRKNVRVPSSIINKYTEDVLTAAQLRKGAKANAEEEVVEKLNRQSVNIQTHISDLERKYAQNSDSWTNLQFDELKQETAGADLA